ncbi:MAG: surfeit locus protein [Alyxoria varia]|nr:MAG: surfeit locus protein [Alyxoria varia]
MAEDLEARLERYSESFEGLMSLIPAKLYYGEDNSDQWKRKKQTKEEKRAAKKAKLAPGAYKSALEVHKENEKKRKREDDEGEEDGDHASDDEKPLQGLEPPRPSGKKPSTIENRDNVEAKSKVEKRKEKRKETREKARKEKEKIKEKRKAKKRAKLEHTAEEEQTSAGAENKTDEDGGKRRRKEKPSRQNEKSQSRANNLSAKHSSATSKDSPADNHENERNFEDDSPDQKDDEDQDHGNGDDQLDDIEGENSRFEVLGDAGETNSKSSLSPSSASIQDHPVFDSSAQQSNASSSSSISPPHPIDDGALKQNPADSTSSEDPSQTNDTPTAKSAFHALPNSSSTEDDTVMEDPLAENTLVVPDDVAPSKDQPIEPQDSTDTKKDRYAESGEASMPKFDADALHARLTAKITALRAERKADGPDGKPARSRQELIEGRRRKEETRKARKKEERAKAREQRTAEEEAARLRGGGDSPLFSPGVWDNPQGPGDKNALKNGAKQTPDNFSFGNMKFEDGAEIDTTSGNFRDQMKRKGPQDPKTALLVAQKKANRLNSMDAEKRADIEEKDRWLGAKKRIQGEKLKDDENLLKKTLKRKEKAKGKSEKQWKERLEGVRKGKEMKQKKREDNLNKRKDEKKKGKPFAVKGKAKPNGQMKKRPGFEGSFRINRKGAGGQKT